MALNVFGFGNSNKISSTEPLPNGQQAGDNGQQQQAGTGQQQQQTNQDPPYDPFKEVYGDDDATPDFELGEDFFKMPASTAVGGQGDDLIPQGQPPEHKAMIDGLRQKIASVALKEDFFPEDFNFNDSRALRGKMNEIMQQSISAALGLMSEPVSAAMQTMASNLRSEMETKVQQGQVKSKAQEHFTPIFNALTGDTGMQKMALDLYKRSLTTTKDPVRSQTAVVEMIKSLGVNINLKNGTSSKVQKFGDFNGQPQGRMNQGDSSDLDNFLKDFAIN